jgi:hypothetical protein
MEILQQIVAAFFNQVPNAELLFLFPIVAVMMSVISTGGVAVGALFDARAEALDREKSMREKMRREEANKLKLLEQVSWE